MQNPIADELAWGCRYLDLNPKSLLDSRAQIADGYSKFKESKNRILRSVSKTGVKNSEKGNI